MALIVRENAIKIDVLIKCKVCMYILQKEAVKPLIYKGQKVFKNNTKHEKKYIKRL